jgi:hypothetical protein
MFLHLLRGPAQANRLLLTMPWMGMKSDRTGSKLGDVRNPISANTIAPIADPMIGMAASAFEGSRSPLQPEVTNRSDDMEPALISSQPYMEPALHFGQCAGRRALSQHASLRQRPPL